MEILKILSDFESNKNVKNKNSLHQNYEKVLNLKVKLKLKNF